MTKAIFLDIDGTMVSFGTHAMPDNTYRALSEARRRGVKVFVATGRLAGDIGVLGNFAFDGYITLNGAYCKAGGETIFKKTLPREDVAAFVDYCENKEPIPAFFVEEHSIAANMKAEIIDEMMALVDFKRRPIRPSKEFLGKEIYQLTAFFPMEREAEIMEMLPGCSATRWYPTFADIIAKGVDKGVGLQKAGEHFGIKPAEMMAFGDGGNDIPMLRYAGTGVAMGNAGDEVKQSADYVTTSVDDDGVGNALRHFGVI